MKFKITIFEGDKIIECKIFDNRPQAEQFIQQYKAEQKPYKTVKNKLYHTMQA